ncbi:hypothetical protein AMAG_08885 [Allomyces macrogynus ATCC 38327]|uniref:Uncharacterized protein n=1 Tax=Allomyces macrogynus (strain ATCC 38327) TaxID=578462 RepID=A0A0L0SN54_ALLM3|nr:hypothetical protein AMAG_08885 [Allomyces macrogynus ATCC 38327]|eukprot:KNE63815.1 hypothetical protein AMAG_08885 [Allomyces macrogynus ATCC 38327]
MLTKSATASTGKKKAGGKKTRSAEEASRQAALAAARVDAVRALRQSYTAQARLFLREPAPAVSTQIDRAAADGVDVDKLVLTKLSLTASDLWALGTAFESYAALTTLTLCMIPLDDKMVAALASFVTAHPALTTLSLVDTHLGPGAAAHLASCVPHSALTALHIDYNSLGSAAWHHFLLALIPPAESDACESCALAVVRVREAAEAAAAAAAKTAAIAALPPPPPKPAPLVEKAKKGAKGKGTKAKKKTPAKVEVVPPPPPPPSKEDRRAARPHTTLARLSCKFAGMDEEVGDAIGRLLAGNSSIKDLDLSGNRLGPRGLLAVMEGLRSNTVLETLNVSANGVRAAAAFAGSPIDANAALRAATAGITAVRRLSRGNLAATSAAAPRGGIAKVRIPKASTAAPPPPAPAAPAATLALPPDTSTAATDAESDPAPPVAPTPPPPPGAAAAVAAALDGLCALISDPDAVSRLASVDLRHNHVGDDGAARILDALKARATAMAGAAGGTGPVPVTVYVSERTPAAVYAKLHDVNRAMEAKRRLMGGKKKKKGGVTGKKKVVRK